MPETAPAAAVAEGTDKMTRGLPAIFKGGVIMDVMNPEQARIAQEAGACAVMALERIPADIRTQKGVVGMSDPKMIKKIVNAVSIPVMAKCRIGHFVEAQVLQQLGVDSIDKSEVLTVAEEDNQVNKNRFKVVCDEALNLGEALRRIAWIPAGAALCMQLGVDGVFLGSGIIRSDCPEKRARAIVKAVTHFGNPQVLAEVSENIGEAMTGINMDDLGVRWASREGGNMEPAAKRARTRSGSRCSAAAL
mmetsp:Transcript_53773/g.141789  ORF Transcript_53773/g.141789 Transcript_53773/m.141789 type:complete len:248 (-) Transcript_53773:36-779(-)